MQRNRGKHRRKKTRDLFRKVENIEGTFHPKMDTIKDRNSSYQKQKILRRDGKNIQKNHTKNIFMTQITTMV